MLLMYLSTNHWFCFVCAISVTISYYISSHLKLEMVQRSTALLVFSFISLPPESLWKWTKPQRNNWFAKTKLSRTSIFGFTKIQIILLNSTFSSTTGKIEILPAYIRWVELVAQLANLNEILLSLTTFRLNFVPVNWCGSVQTRIVPFSNIFHEFSAILLSKSSDSLKALLPIWLKP